LEVGSTGYRSGERSVGDVHHRLKDVEALLLLSHEAFQRIIRPKVRSINLATGGTWKSVGPSIQEGCLDDEAEEGAPMPRVSIAISD
jgi:hypothetical protein